MSKAKEVITVGGRGVEICGDLVVGTKAVRVKADVNGSIKSLGVVILDGGCTVSGEVIAHHLIIEDGIVESDLTCKRVHMSRNATVNGNVKAATLNVDEGAVINGKCIISPESTSYDEASKSIGIGVLGKELWEQV